MTIILFIEHTLQALHISKRYDGFHLLAAAVELAFEDESRLRRVQKDIYCPVAERFGCKASNVERNIRTIAQKLWEEYPDTLDKLSGFPVSRAPSASELIELIMSYVQRSYPVEV